MNIYIRSIIKILSTTLLIATVTFFLLYLIPGSPFSNDKSLPPEVFKNLESKYNLDKPVYVQYFAYVNNLIHGYLGPSLKYTNRSVNEIIGQSFPVSFFLGALALLISVPLGILLGIFAAVKNNSFIGKVISILMTMFISVPNFLIAAVLINVFALRFKLFPVALFESPMHIVLPVITLSFLPTAYIARITRAKVLEQLKEEYVMILLAKGLHFKDILFKHALKNSLISIITVLGPIIAILITGSFVVEFIFAIPGMGRHFVYGFINRDYFLICGITIVFSLILTSLNIITDFMYRKIDPRLG